MREFFKRPLFGYLAFLVGVTLAFYAYTNSQSDQLRAGLESSCQRVNILRAQSNLSDVVLWKTLSSAGRRELELANKDRMNTRASHIRSAQQALAAASDITITGMTDCQKAIDKPNAYQVPVAGPVGDPTNSKLSAPVRDIIDDSKRTIAREND